MSEKPQHNDDTEKIQTGEVGFKETLNTLLRDITVKAEIMSQDEANDQLFELELSLAQLSESCACKSREENEFLLEFMAELELVAKKINRTLSGDSNTAIYSSIARMLFKENMGKEEILALIYKVNDISFTSGLLYTNEVVERLGIDQMSNDEIMAFCNLLLEEYYKKTKGFSFEGWKTHIAYLIEWPLFKHLKLQDMSLEELIQFGEKYNTGYLWRKILREEKKYFIKMTYNERVAYAERIAKCYGASALDSSREITLKRVLNFGGPVATVLNNLIEHNYKNWSDEE